MSSAEDIINIDSINLNNDGNINNHETMDNNESIDNSYKRKFTKPIIKWVGGKTGLLDKVISRFPTEINNYHEPFLGGGSVLLALLTLKEENKIKITGIIYACDFNEGLINLYKNIQNHKDELYTKIIEYKNIYSSIEISNCTKEERKITENTTLEEAKRTRESYYYWLRYRFNTEFTNGKESIDYSALFVVLNKLCFRGVYREGPNGFNVPFEKNRKSVPEIINKEHLDKVSELIKDVEFRTCSFESSSIMNVQDGDFVYLDPPYAPENDKSFVGYTKDGFTLENHKKLFGIIKNFASDKKKFALSNHKVKLITDNFSSFNIDEFEVKRRCNSKNPESKTIEVIVHN